MQDFLNYFSTAPIEFIDWSVSFLQSVPWYIILIFAFFITLLENIFPPAPCDSILLFMGSLVPIGVVAFAPLLILASFGSLAGFYIMYYLGLKFGQKIIDTNRFSFISKEKMEKPERWFQKYGYTLIVVNRFLAGTRAVIAFFAGISALDQKKSMVLSLISAFVWNGILIGLGWVFANNLDLVKEYIKGYGKIAFPIILGLLILWFIWWLVKDKKK